MLSYECNELAASDLVYVSDDSQIGYPVVRSMSPPDNQFFPWLMGMRNAMEMMLTGESINGEEAVIQGFANKCFKKEKLSREVERIAIKWHKFQQTFRRLTRDLIPDKWKLWDLGTELELELNSKHCYA